MSITRTRPTIAQLERRLLDIIAEEASPAETFAALRAATEHLAPRKAIRVVGAALSTAYAAALDHPDFFVVDAAERRFGALHKALGEYVDRTAGFAPVGE